MSTSAYHDSFRMALSRLGTAGRKKLPPEEYAEARRDFVAARLMRDVHDALADGNPPYAEQRAAAIRLLSGEDA